MKEHRKVWASGKTIYQHGNSGKGNLLKYTSRKSQGRHFFKEERLTTERRKFLL